MSGTDYKFEGWLGHDAESVKGNMKWGEFEPKKWSESLKVTSDCKSTTDYFKARTMSTLRSPTAVFVAQICTH